MTNEQATGIWRLLLAAFPTQPVEAPTAALYLDHLRALPWREGRTEAAIRGLIAGSVSPFLPAIGAVVAAAGVAPEAAHLLVEAMRTGQELAVDLNARSGWSVGQLAALAAPAMSEEQRRENLRRLGGLYRELGHRGKAS